MAATAAQKKALADAKALLAKQKAQLAILEKQQADLAAANKAAADEAAAASAASAKIRTDAAAAKAAAANAGYNNVPGLTAPGSNIYQMLGGNLYFNGQPYSGVQGGIRYINGVSYGEALPTVDTTPKLAIDTFKATLATFFGQQEMSKPWVTGLYNSVNKFTNSGATVEEAFNMALLQGRNDPNMTEFNNRFKGIFALQDAKAKGGTVEVPTIAEYFHTEKVMGDVLRNTGLGSLATEDFLGGVIGQGVDATEFSNRITTVFDRIDQAPDQIKKTLNEFFPSVDRASLAKALLTGTTGAKQLEQQIQGYEVLSAAEQQGVRASDALPGGITAAQAANYAAAGQTYSTAMQGFGQVAQARATEQKLSEISGQTAMGVAGLSEAVLGKNAAQLARIESLTTQEENRFKGKTGAGTLASSKRNQEF